MSSQSLPPPINPSLGSVPASASSTSTPPSQSQSQSQTTLPLPKIFSSSTTPPTLITQGAEALLYQTTYLLPSLPCALKYRPSKPYRHPILDARLTKHRILSEARVLVKLRKDGVPVPAVYALDERSGWLCLEWIPGDVVRVCINRFLGKRGTREDGDESEGALSEGDDGWEELKELMGRIGRAVAGLHASGVVHGDLTTSNLMLRPPPGSPTNDNSKESLLEGDVVLIDFGLASMMAQDEDRAVDLYVLERAFGSTHPRAEGLFKEVLAAYGKAFKGGNAVLKKLEDVRMRGRKRSMIG